MGIGPARDGEWGSFTREDRAQRIFARGSFYLKRRVHSVVGNILEPTGENPYKLGEFFCGLLVGLPGGALGRDCFTHNNRCKLDYVVDDVCRDLEEEHLDCLMLPELEGGRKQVALAPFGKIAFESSRKFHCTFNVGEHAYLHVHRIL
jgi:hypothetical protein